MNTMIESVLLIAWINNQDLVKHEKGGKISYFPSFFIIIEIVQMVKYQ
jgi:hypothetical protein